MLADRLEPHEHGRAHAGAARRGPARDRRGGFANATVGEITREAGASLGLLNYHFGSKDEVVAEAFAAAAREDLAELEAISRRHDDPADRLAAYLDLAEWADRESWRLWVDAWGESVHTEPLRATRSAVRRRLARGAGRACWPTACARALGVRGPRRTPPARLVAVLDGIGLHTTVHGERRPARARAAWARRLAELELGVTLPGAPPPRAARRPAPRRTRRASRSAARDLDAPATSIPPCCSPTWRRRATAWLDARLGGTGRRARVTARRGRLPRVPARRRDGRGHGALRAATRLGRAGVRTRETIATADGALVVSAGATVDRCRRGRAPRR